MARIRSIKPEFFVSEQVVECSTNARLLFVGLWVFSDDCGRKRYSPKTLKMEVFPGDSFTADEVSAMFDELVAAGLVSLYVVDGTTFSLVNGWHHQRIDKPQPAKCPPPEDGDFLEHSRNVPRPFPPDRIGEDRIGVDKKEGRVWEGNAASPLSPAATHSRGKPESYRPENEPLPYPSTDFATAWLAWCRHRAEIRKPLKPTSVRQQLAELAKIGEPRALAMLRNTVAMGWQGLREPGRDSPSAPDEAEMIRAKRQAQIAERKAREAAEVARRTDEELARQNGAHRR